MKENTITGSARRSGKKRIRWIDLARAFGILTVVLCHCVHEIYRLQLTYMSSLHRTGRLFGFAAFTAGRLGVPLFLMISGYLLLNRSYTADRCRHFFRHNFLRLLACTEIWFLFYHIFLSVTNLQDFSLRDMLWAYTCCCPRPPMPCILWNCPASGFPISLSWHTLLPVPSWWYWRRQPGGLP